MSACTCGATTSRGPCPCQVDGARDPLVGSTLAGARVEAVLGRGQAGTVYRARRGAELVAVKVPAADVLADPVALRRFEREAAALAMVDHPGVVRLLATAVTADGRPALVMELVAGRSLEDALAAGPMRPIRAVQLARQLAEALASAHAHHLLHRDLKPSNVMLVASPAGERAVLIDFGLALSVDLAGPTRLTMGCGLVGTPHYMAPEQAAGDDLDGRADVCALGATLYRMVSGRVPFDGGLMEVVLAHASAEPPALPAGLPAPLRALITRCLRKAPADRPSAPELAVVLAALAEQLVATQVGPAATVIGVGEAGRGRATRAVAAALTGAAPAAAVGPARPERLGAGRRRVAAWLASAAALALIGLGVATVGPSAQAALGATVTATAPARPLGEVTPPGPGELTPPPRPLPVGHRVVLQVDAVASVRVVLPEQVRADEEARLEVELWSDDGRPITSGDVVITVEGDGEPRGYAASRRGTVYTVTHHFAQPGRARVRIFPPDGASSFVVEVDVQPAPRLG